MSAAIKFGNFEADFHSRQIRRYGVSVAMQAQPFAVLEALLQKPGQLITREVLKNKIWPELAFIDSERGLNKAVNRLRDALGDRSESPRFIETLPKRGYRWIAPLVYELRSLALIPLVDQSGDPSRSHWADGISDELINAIAQISGLHVISPTSSRRFKNSDQTIQEIARLLNVDAVLHGSVVVSDKKLAIRVHLIEALSEHSIWFGSYEAELDEIVTLQRRIASAVAAELHAKLVTNRNSLTERAERVHPDAYQACLKGRLFWERRTEVDLEKSIEQFNRAAILDAAYPEPYVGFADAQIMLGIFGLRQPREVFPSARVAAEKALLLDGNLSGAHTSLGMVLSVYFWEMIGAEQKLKRALELNPNSSIGYQWYGSHLSQMGRNAEAVASVEKARTLDPLSVVINAFLGLTYFKARQFSAGVNAAKEAVELDPNSPFAHYILSRTLCGVGDYDAAVCEAEAACALSRNQLPFAAHVGYTYGCAGRRDEALAVLAQLHELRQERYVSAYELAVIYLSLENENQAVEWLERSLEERASKLTELLDPTFDSIRHHAVVSRILSQLGIR